MKTDQLIDLLATDAPSSRSFRSVVGLAILGGVVIAAIVFFITIGIRPDVATALLSGRFLFKFVVTVALAATAVRAVLGLGRPDGSFSVYGPALVLAPVLLACAVAFELWVLPEDSWMSRLVGQNARFCLVVIPLLSAGPLVCLLAALRQGAPSQPGFAGAVAGLAAGGIGATFYAAHCPDDSPLFVMTWYSLAVLTVTTVGYAAGRRLLRW